MGTVYLAHRDDREFDQAVALKVVRAADSEEILRRFELERQIVASLQHPNIARLLDGGRTGDGRPYFVMEYVEGAPIDVHCDRRRLSIDRRLALFMRVGRAVQHAHRNLVVHRDLKPSNIVVTGDGEVKLLDFGIAKLLAPAPFASEPLTRTVGRLLTPEYASPEQVRGEPVTTAADVYQLGLLLYELLTGERAHRIEDGSPSSLERAICEQPVDRPSAVVAASASAETCAARLTTVSGLARRLRGDLDTIVLMALRKEPDRRYASAAELVEDLERYRGGLPVRARQDTVVYRAAKLARRHPFGLAATVALTVLITAYAGTVTYQARHLAAQQARIELEARKARQVADFLVGLFEAADPVNNQGDAVTAGELVRDGVRQVRTELAEQPEIQAEMLVVLGKVSLNLSRLDRALELTSEAVALQRRIHSGDHADLARALVAKAGILRLLDQFEESAAHDREALEMRLRLHGEDHPEVAESLSNLGYSMVALRRLEEAEELVRRALAVYRNLGGEYEAEVGTALNRLGILLRRQERLDESILVHREALALRQRVYRPDHPQVATSLNNLGSTLSASGRLAEAEPLYRQSVALTRQAVGDGHGLLATPLHNLGKVLRGLGRLEESEAVHREALAIRIATRGEEHSSVATSLTSLGETLRDAGHREEAERLFRQALATYRASLAEGDPLIADAALQLGRLLAARGELGEAEELLVEALTLRIAGYGEQSAATAEAQIALGLSHTAQGREDEARALIEPGLETLRATPGCDPALAAEAERALAALGPPG
jgi:serine/threonine-protein kinase